MNQIKIIRMNSLAPNLNIFSPVLPNVAWYKKSLIIAVVVSTVFHGVILLLKKSEPHIDPKHLKAPLAVVLVNSQSPIAPINPKRLAQHNLNGGGQLEEPMVASSISPMMPSITEKLNTLQEEQQRLLSSMREDGSQFKKTTQGKVDAQKDATDPLEAELAMRMELESQRPRKAVLTSTSARSVIYAEYYNSMRNKVEAYGTRYFPRSQGKPLYGSLIVMISIDREGQIVKKPSVEKSSGNVELDRQTLAIIQACAPFDKFSAGMRSQLDVIDWIATFSFVNGGGQSQLELNAAPTKP
jgi:periplasmic protein TonB